MTTKYILNCGCEFVSAASNNAFTRNHTCGRHAHDEHSGCMVAQTAELSSDGSRVGGEGYRAQGAQPSAQQPVTQLCDFTLDEIQEVAACVAAAITDLRIERKRLREAQRHVPGSWATRLAVIAAEEQTLSAALAKLRIQTRWSP